jgi:DNA-binding CsgD family transcriptional regulator/PAS domain-containing protein
MATLDHLSVTLEKIYAAAGDASHWDDALRAIEDFTGCTGAVLNLVPKHAAAPPGTFAGSFSRSDCDDYSFNCMAHCPRIAFAMAHPEVPIHYDRLILSETEMDHDPVYEWFGKHGLRYYVAGFVGENSSYHAYMSMQRSRRQGHASPADIDRFALIKRHVEQALSLTLRLGLLEQQCHLGFELLDVVPYAIFALDTARRVLFMNRRAEQIVERGDGLAIEGGRMHCRVTEQQPVLERLMTAALGNGAPARGGWARLHRSSGRRPYLVLVSCFTPTEEMLQEFQPRALIIVSDPDEVPKPEAEALRQVYGLSDTEARLASALASGHSVQSAAQCLGMAAETARFHLKTIFRKLGVNRQQDLVRQLATVGYVGTQQSA